MVGLPFQCQWPTPWEQNHVDRAHVCCPAVSQAPKQSKFVHLWPEIQAKIEDHDPEGAAALQQVTQCSHSSEEIEDAVRAVVKLHNWLGHRSGQLLPVLLATRVLLCGFSNSPNSHRAARAPGYRRRDPLPVAWSKVSEPLAKLQLDGFGWAHPVTGMRVRDSLMVDEGSYQA